MAYEIDQSGKIEQGSFDTVIAAANSKHASVKLGKRHKKFLKEKYLDSSNPSRTYVYAVFSALVAILIYYNELTGRIIIDREYYGQEDTILSNIFHYLTRLGYKNLKTISIEFGIIGKHSTAHHEAIEIFRGKKKSTREVTFHEVVRLLSTEEFKKDRAPFGPWTT